MLVVCLCADWCDTCREFQPLFARLAPRWPDIDFRWCDIEESDEWLAGAEVENFPSILLVDAAGGARFVAAIVPTEAALESLLRAATQDRLPACPQAAPWQPLADRLRQVGAGAMAMPGRAAN